eukprot:gene34634-biopygen34685
MSKVERPAGRKVLDILHAGWQPREVTTSDSPPHYRANIMGEPMRALPTIMATQNSFAFRAPRMGSLLSTTKGEVSAREVNLEEKSRAMGYNVHELRMTDDVDEVKLAQVLGLAMDRRAMELLYSVAEASRRGLPYSQEDHSKVVACKRDPEPEAPAQESLQASAAEWISRSSSYTKQLAEGISHEDWERKLQQMCAQGHKGSRAPKAWVPGWSSHARRAGRRERSWSPTVWRAAREKPMRLPTLDDTARLTELMASMAQQEAQREDHRDIHDDEWTLSWLRSKGTVELPDHVNGQRVRKRASRHRWDEATDEIYMITLAGKELRVPKPGDRLQLVKEYHARTGHWGIRRTLNLLWQRN